MIKIRIESQEDYDEESNSFITIPGGTFDFEYSLKAIGEWEMRWKKPFLKGERTPEETVDFYRLMSTSPIDKRFITVEVMEILSEYLKDTRTATTFSSRQNDDRKGGPVKVSTSEEVYALMFEAGVPLEFENRNFNYLLTILKVIANRSNPPKKMSKEEIYKQNAELNAARKKQLNTKG